MKNTTKSKAVMVIDDHTLFREGLRAMLEPQEQIESVIVASTIHEALQYFRTDRVDVELLDVTLEHESGIAAIPTVRGVSPETKVVVITMHTSVETVRSAFDAGAHAFIGKDVSLPELVHAIEVVCAGDRYVMDGIDVSTKSDRSESLWTQYLRLSPRENEIFLLLAEGKRPREIAAKLGMAKKTTKSHRYNVLTKLEIENAGELAQAAFDLGLPHS